jgi:hypothetical protein
LVELSLIFSFTTNTLKKKDIEKLHLSLWMGYNTSKNYEGVRNTKMIEFEI